MNKSKSMFVKIVLWVAVFLYMDLGLGVELDPFKTPWKMLSFLVMLAIFTETMHFLKDLEKKHG